jgi:hypothetical protein
MVFNINISLGLFDTKLDANFQGCGSSSLYCRSGSSFSLECDSGSDFLLNSALKPAPRQSHANPRPRVYRPLPGLYFKPPRLQCERPRPSPPPRFYFKPCKLLNFDFNAVTDSFQIFTIMRIWLRIQLPKIMRILIHNPANFSLLSGEIACRTNSASTTFSKLVQNFCSFYWYMSLICAIY